MGKKFIVEEVEEAEDKSLGCGGVVGIFVIGLIVMALVNLCSGEEKTKKPAAATEKRVEQLSPATPPVKKSGSHTPPVAPPVRKSGSQSSKVATPVRSGVGGESSLTLDALHDDVTGTGQSSRSVKSSGGRPERTSSAASKTATASTAIQRSVTTASDREDNIVGATEAETDTDTLTNKERRKLERQAKRQAKREARLQNKMQEND